ncbi:thiamine pyrophosphate-dependent enzyme [Rhizobium aegyptiacum]|uniref:thiamine pyrophosphate-dependent enzyme n=1 Tax=Rhizobium aegyptiacum TaxID=1764550 RepID=UPI001FD8EA71|nr:thiamine pyrophosphate-dependent enzyme [Rhizobium aegyptiacum]
MKIVLGLRRNQPRLMSACGDAGLQMTGQELEAAVRLKLNLVVLIQVDGGHGVIRWKQAAKWFPGSAPPSTIRIS